MYKCTNSERTPRSRHFGIKIQKAMKLVEERQRLTNMQTQYKRLRKRIERQVELVRSMETNVGMYYHN